MAGMPGWLSTVLIAVPTALEQTAAAAKSMRSATGTSTGYTSAAMPPAASWRRVRLSRAG
jgi:hypothetical protein